jgi:hypothetical protein
VPLWKKFWILLSVIWVVVSGLNAATIIAFSPDEAQKAWRPALLGIAVPAVLYVILWLWARWQAGREK